MGDRGTYKEIDELQERIVPKFCPIFFLQVENLKNENTTKLRSIAEERQNAEDGFKSLLETTKAKVIIKDPAMIHRNGVKTNIS